MRHVFRVTLLFAALASSAYANAEAKELDKLRAECEAKLDEYSWRAERSKLASNILLITGAVIAAAGSALAGFLTKSKMRKAAAITGALGAVVAVVPKTLPDATELMQRHDRAGKHRDAGRKVLYQLSEIGDDKYIPTCREYVIARFVECAGIYPGETVPELPRLRESKENFAKHDQLKDPSDPQVIEHGLSDPEVVEHWIAPELIMPRIAPEHLIMPISLAGSRW